MCLFRRKRNYSSRKQTTVNWPTDGGPSDADYEKDTFDYYVSHKNDKDKSSFGDDSSMTP